jgi:DNA-binding FrmR family transcriptional regulator
LHSYDEIKPELLLRLKKVEGQVRGLQRMIEGDRYCVEVLTQLVAVSQGLRSVTRKVVERHARGCVSKAITEGRGEEAVDELVKLLFKFAQR